MPESGIIRYSDHIDDIGNDFFEIARKNNLEGIIAKKKDSVYIPDSRAKTWLFNWRRKEKAFFNDR